MLPPFVFSLSLQLLISAVFLVVQCGGKKRFPPPKQPKGDQSTMNKSAAPADNKIGAVPSQASKPAASAELDKDKSKDPGVQSTEDGKDKKEESKQEPKDGDDKEKKDDDKGAKKDDKDAEKKDDDKKEGSKHEGKDKKEASKEKKGDEEKEGEKKNEEKK
ncbi:hypothetical protein WR25_21059 [Diploscapter pachys]|uniref:Uncharacterized protein n=1 Tax=Diploscapter pachys TaxID=2018661 RepID=A0A2A2KSF0_9BILA|nr:hypothetical protein WR25_21059 [Diploscapter pachys]